MLRTVAQHLAATAALSIPLLLVGCTATVPFAGGRPVTANRPPEAGPTASGAPPPSRITFTAGADLDPGMTAQWGDAFSTDADYVLTKPDDGNGGWAYTHGATQCIVHFWQGGFAGPVGGDDRILTDALLAQAVEMAPEEVTPHAADDTVSQLAGGTVEVRTLAGQVTGGEFFMIGRVFGALSTGILVDVGCPVGRSPENLYSSIESGRLAILVDSPVDE